MRKGLIKGVSVMIKSETIKGQDSWVLDTRGIKVCITKKGGHMAPVLFMRDTGNPIKPFYVNPWAGEHPAIDKGLEVLVPLRGDFFCLPFGGNNKWNGENHPVHGETSYKEWTLADDSSDDSISLTMDTKIRKGSVTKKVELREGENNLYVSHTVEGFAGPVSVGHHAIFPGNTKKYISTSSVRYGYTNRYDGPGYNGGEYYSLASFKKFESLEKVPTIWKETPYTDCSVFPAREGFVDILQVFNRAEKDFAWSAVCAPEEGYLWFSLKDPEILPSTVLWMENKGRHMSPWDGRNSCIGVEDVCGHLADGLSVSAEENILTRDGIKTAHVLKGDRIFTVTYIHGVVRIPEGFYRVKAIEKKNNGVQIVSYSGKSVFTKVGMDFLKS